LYVFTFFIITRYYLGEALATLASSAQYEDTICFGWQRLIFLC